jgi:hypothetical protein
MSQKTEHQTCMLLGPSFNHVAQSQVGDVAQFGIDDNTMIKVAACTCSYWASGLFD